MTLAKMSKLCLYIILILSHNIKVLTDYKNLKITIVYVYTFNSIYKYMKKIFITFAILTIFATPTTIFTKPHMFIIGRVRAVFINMFTWQTMSSSRQRNGQLWHLHNVGVQTIHTIYQTRLDWQWACNTVDTADQYFMSSV